MRYTSDVDTYRAFYIEHKDRLFAYLIRMTGDYYLSSDLMQESFTRYLEHYSRRPQTPSLLYTIARNTLFDHMRRHTPKPLLDGDRPDCSHDQEHNLLVREEYRRVLSALQELEKEERDLLALAISSDLSYREIGLIAGISEANVKVKVHLARLKLKKILGTGDE